MQIIWNGYTNLTLKKWRSTKIDHTLFPFDLIFYYRITRFLKRTIVINKYKCFEILI